MYFLTKNELIYHRQFGFRAKHSTNHALISSTEAIKSHLDSKKIVAGVFIDLEKAFDTVNHNILCDKLTYYGFRGVCQKLIKSFLRIHGSLKRTYFVFQNRGIKPVFLRK